MVLACCRVPPCHSLSCFHQPLISGGRAFLLIVWRQHSGCWGTFTGNCCDVMHTVTALRVTKEQGWGTVFWFLVSRFLSHFFVWKEAEGRRKTFCWNRGEQKTLHLGLWLRVCLCCHASLMGIQSALSTLLLTKKVSEDYSFIAVYFL